MTKVKSQIQQVQSHLKKFRRITSWEAIQQYKITRLSEYIRRLRNEGLNITSHWVRANNKNFVEYRYKKS